MPVPTPSSTMRLGGSVLSSATAARRGRRVKAPKLQS
jgi:hypothetical protein